MKRIFGGCLLLLMLGAGGLGAAFYERDRFHADLPDSELRLYPGVGHVPQEEAPERTAQDARAFLLRSEPEPPIN